MDIKSRLGHPLFAASMCIGLLSSPLVFASSLVWVPPVTSYIQNDAMSAVTPEFTDVPASDTDGNFEVKWQGESETFLLEVASATTDGQTFLQTEQASTLRQIFSNLVQQTTADDSDTNWQTVYTGSDTEADISGLAEGEHIFRISSCDDDICIEADVSEPVLVDYQITPQRDLVYVQAFDTVEINVLANDWDPTQPDVSIYNIVDEVQLYISPNSGTLEQVGNRFYYTNTHQACVANSYFYDWFYYTLVDDNGEESEQTEVSIRVNCDDGYYLPTWVSLPSDSLAEGYQFFVGDDGNYYLRTVATEWISLGFLTVPNYANSEYYQLVYADNVWSAVTIDASEFDGLSMEQTSYAIQGMGTQNGSLGLNIAFADGDVIDIQWPSATVGELVVPELTLPDTTSCQFAAMSTSSFMQTENSFTFYQPGSFNATYQCSSAELGTYEVDTPISIYSLSAPENLQKSDE